MVPPTGEQVEITSGSQRAVVVEVGGGLREYTVDGRPVLFGFGVDQMAPGACGIPLIPWPNRIEDGRYDFDGEPQQLALSEPAKGNAIHGLLRWSSWRVHQREADAVVIANRIHPQKGYPFTLDVEIAYRLDAAGLTVTTTARNLGPRALPFGAGQHPYLVVGTGTIDPCTLQLDAALLLPTDARGLPTGERKPVDGSELDFRPGRRLGAQKLDHCFGALGRDEEGRTWARLIAPDGRRTALWADAAYPFLQVFTGDTLAPEHRRRALAVEPMSCAPNAFRSGDGLVRLEPGAGWTGRWGVRAG